MNDIGAWGFTYPLLFLPKSKWQDLDAGTGGHTPFLTGKAEVLGGGRDMLMPGRMCTLVDLRTGQAGLLRGLLNPPACL